MNANTKREVARRLVEDAENRVFWHWITGKPKAQHEAYLQGVNKVVGVLMDPAFREDGPEKDSRLPGYGLIWRIEGKDVVGVRAYDYAQAETRRREILAMPGVSHVWISQA